MEDKKSNTKESNEVIASEITLSERRLEELNAFTKPLNLTDYHKIQPLPYMVLTIIIYLWMKINLKNITR